MNEQTACAHCKVILKHIDHEDGTRSDYWECDSGCGRKFVPDTTAIREDVIPTRFHFRTQFLAHEITATKFDRMVSPFYEGDKWAVRRLGWCLRKDHEWEYEPLPSSRDDDFYARCRFDSINEAISAYEIAEEKHTFDEGTTNNE
jgi:hypothetical protein